MHWTDIETKPESVIRSAKTHNASKIVYLPLTMIDLDWGFWEWENGL